MLRSTSPSVFLLAAVLLWAGAVGAQTRGALSVADIAQFQGPNRTQALIDGAKKEGEVSVYLSQPAVGVVTQAFGRKYGINVKTWRASSEQLLQRTVSEARGGRFDVDLSQASAPEMEALHRERLLQPATSPLAATLMREAVPSHREWIGIAINRLVQGYNTSKIRKEDLPRTWQDLLDPKWKGQLGIEASDQDWFAYALQDLGRDKGMRLFKEIVARNGISVRKGHSLLAQLVASGEVPLALTLYSWNPDLLKEKGAPVERFDISQPIANLIGIGIMRRAPHPYSAMLLYDYMIGEGQEILSKEHAIATSNKYDTDQKRVPIRFIDPALSLDRGEQWLQDFNEVFVSRNK